MNIKEIIKKRKNVKPSHGEKIVIQYLRKNKIKFHREHSMPGLINPKTGYPLFFDFYLPSLRLIIEVDGKQHYEAINGFDEFTSLVYRDEIKNKFCIENNLKMLRIIYAELKPPYTVLADAIGGQLIYRRITKQQKGFKKKKYIQKVKPKKEFKNRKEYDKKRIGKNVFKKIQSDIEIIEQKRAAARNRYPSDIKKRLGI